MKNTMFPGRANYTGPTSGLFGILHHDSSLVETSHNVMERVAYVKAYKPKHEVEIRLHNMIYLGDCPAAHKRAPLDADYKAQCDSLDADYKAKRAPLDADVLVYIKANIPDCAWNERELDFTTGSPNG